jgi:hypothetical protein
VTQEGTHTLNTVWVNCCRSNKYNELFVAGCSICSVHCTVLCPPSNNLAPQFTVLPSFTSGSSCFWCCWGLTRKRQNAAGTTHFPINLHRYLQFKMAWRWLLYQQVQSSQYDTYNSWILFFSLDILPGVNCILIGRQEILKVSLYIVLKQHHCTIKKLQQYWVKTIVKKPHCLLTTVS